MTIEELPGPLAEQIRLTIQQVRTASEDGTFTQDDFPKLSEAYLNLIESRIHWRPGEDPKKERHAVVETAYSQLWKVMQNLNLCTDMRVFDRGLYAAYALKPAALEWTHGDVALLKTYLRFHDREVRERAARELAKL